MSKNIIVDCERMKYPYTGLYFYCLHLAKSLIETNSDRNNLNFYTRKSTLDLFPQNSVIEQKSRHKFIFPDVKNFDIWHSTYQGTQYYPARKKIKIVFTIHDLNFLYDSSKDAGKKKKYLKELEQKIKRADHIVAISNYTLKDVLENFDLTNKPHSVIYNGCNIEEITGLQKPKILPEKKFLFTIGTILRKKNFHVLPALLVKNDFGLIIAGITDDENYRNEIVENAKLHGVQNRVIFTDSISENDKQWYLKNCEAFLFPSISEGFGLPVIEAMYFGKPVILSTATSLPEIGGNEADYFESFDADSMQQTLNNALNNYSNNPEKKDAIIKRAMSFNWLESAHQYHKVYASL